MTRSSSEWKRCRTIRWKCSTDLIALEMSRQLAPRDASPPHMAGGRVSEFLEKLVLEEHKSPRIKQRHERADNTYVVKWGDAGGQLLKVTVCPSPTWQQFEAHCAKEGLSIEHGIGKLLDEVLLGRLNGEGKRPAAA